MTEEELINTAEIMGAMTAQDIAIELGVSQVTANAEIKENIPDDMIINAKGLKIGGKVYGKYRPQKVIPWNIFYEKIQYPRECLYLDTVETTQDLEYQLSTINTQIHELTLQKERLEERLKKD